MDAVEAKGARKTAVVGVLAIVAMAAAGMAGFPSRQSSVAPPSRSAPPRSAWADPALVEKRWVEAQLAAEDVSQTKFRAKTMGVAAGGLEQPRERAMALISLVSGESPDTMLAWGIRSDANQEGQGVELQVYPAPSKSRRDPGASFLRTEGALRLALVHAAVVLLDQQRFPFAESGADRSGDADLAFHAVREGHAQWVTERVAKRLGLEAAARRLYGPNSSLGWSDWRRRKEDAEKGVVMRGLTFGSKAGAAFVDVVGKGRGVEGIDAALANAPKTMAEIEDPVKWLDAQKAVKSEPAPTAGRGPDKVPAPTAPAAPGARKVKVEVFDADGLAVPRAKVTAKFGDRDPVTKEARKGEATFTVPPGPATFTATDAENEDREPLELVAPDPVEIDPDATEVTLRFKKP